MGSDLTPATLDKKSPRSQGGKLRGRFSFRRLVEPAGGKAGLVLVSHHSGGEAVRPIGGGVRFRLGRERDGER